ncbi:MAG: HAD family hydrolase [Bacillota bacterium]
MISLDLPSGETFRLESVVFDYNGTLACDGCIEEGVGERLRQLSERVKVYVLTADTFGKAKEECAGLPVSLKVVSQSDGMADKARFVRDLGAGKTVCIGNGINDSLMMAECALGIVVLGREGCSARTLIAADIAVNNIRDAIDLLLNPKRLVATLRR